MSKWIKNNSGVTKTYVGQQIADQTYYEIQFHEETAWSHHSPLITDISNGDAVVARDDSGTTDITDISEAIDHLRDENPIQIDSATPVHQFALTEADNLRARLVGIINQTVTKNQTSDLDWAVPQTAYSGQNKQGYMDGIEYYAKDAEVGDKMSFQVIDKDGVGVLLGWYDQATFDAMGNLYVVDEFGKDWAVIPNDHTTIRLYKAKLVPGLYIRVKYTSIGTVNDVYIICNLFRHMDTSVDL
jgi:hypothetical protein